jgi:hypothetical protein
MPRNDILLCRKRDNYLVLGTHHPVDVDLDSVLDCFRSDCKRLRQGTWSGRAATRCVHHIMYPFRYRWGKIATRKCLSSQIRRRQIRPPTQLGCVSVRCMALRRTCARLKLEVSPFESCPSSLVACRRSCTSHVCTNECCSDEPLFRRTVNVECRRPEQQCIG